MSCARFRVTGRVQGVFFRASTQREARRLELVGYARNLHDGSVEVEAQGSAEALEEFSQWLAHGPPHAQVSGLSRDACVEPMRHGDFVIS